MLLSERLAHRLFTPALLVAAAALSAPASAQCPVPDNLDGGPCCALTADTVPWFKKVAQPSIEICWRDCGVAAVLPLRAVWTPIKILPSTGPDCSYRWSRLDLYDPVGTLWWSGVMRLLYSRTWLEAGPAGTPIQVWRFLVNGDLRPTAAVAPPPCPLPPCAPAFNGRVRFTGYIDYASDCTAANLVSIAWMLTHACDPIDHAPGFPRAGAFHPGMSYTFVGPSAGFVPAPVVAPEGTPGAPLEAVRRLIHPPLGAVGPIQCEFEERTLNHVLPTTTFCFCFGGPPLNPQWVIGPLSVAGSCGTTVTTPGGPLLPGFLSMSIGTWTAPGVFPGVEDVRWNTGNYNYTEGCTGVLRNEVFFGVTTLGGFPAVQVTSGGPGAILPLTFIDQSNSIRTGGGVLMNVPYLSDHILNLNH